MAARWAQPVADRREMVDSRQTPRRARKALFVAQQHPHQHGVGSEPEPVVGSREGDVERGQATRVSKRALKSQRRRLSSPDHAVHPDVLADAEPAPQLFRAVVGDFPGPLNSQTYVVHTAAYRHLRRGKATATASGAAETTGIHRARNADPPADVGEGGDGRHVGQHGPADRVSPGVEPVEDSPLEAAGASAKWRRRGRDGVRPHAGLATPAASFLPSELLTYP